MEKSNEVFHETVDSLFKGMDGFLSTKTVVGEAIHIGDTIILPLVNVTFGVGAGAFRDERKANCGGGLGGKMSPSAVLVIHNGSTRLINVYNNSGIEKLLDMIPDFVDRFAKNKSKSDEDDGRAEAAKVMEDMITDAASKTE